MKPKLYAIYAFILGALLLLLPILSAVAGEILYEDNFTNLDPSWGIPGERLSVQDGKLTLKPAPDTTQSILNQANVFDDADIQRRSHSAGRRCKRPRRFDFLGKRPQQFLLSMY